MRVASSQTTSMARKVSAGRSTSRIRPAGSRRNKARILGCALEEEAAKLS